MGKNAGAKPPAPTKGPITAFGSSGPQPFMPSQAANPTAPLPSQPMASPVAPPAAPSGVGYEQAASQRNIRNANAKFNPNAPFPTFRPAGAEIGAWLAKNGFATPSK